MHTQSTIIHRTCIGYICGNELCMSPCLSRSVYHCASLLCNNGSLSTSITSAQCTVHIDHTVHNCDGLGIVLSSQTVMCAGDGHCIVQLAVYISTGKSINILNNYKFTSIYYNWGFSPVMWIINHMEILNKATHSKFSQVTSVPLHLTIYSFIIGA